MGTDLFGGQWPKLHAEEQARKKATQEAQKLLKGSQPGRRGGRGNSLANQQPFRAGPAFQGHVGQGQFGQGQFGQGQFFPSQVQTAQSSQVAPGSGLQPSGGRGRGRGHGGNAGRSRNSRKGKKSTRPKGKGGRGGRGGTQWLSKGQDPLAQSGGSSPGVCGGMAICDLRPLGLGGGIIGLSPRVHSSPATLSGSHSNPPPSGSRSTGSAPSGDQVLGSQRCSGAPRRSRAGGLLLHFLPHNEEIRRVEAHTQPQAPQPFHSPSSLPHGNFDSSNQSTAAGLVGRHFRPSRRLPPCSRSQILAEMAAFRCGSFSLPVPSPSLWSLNCPPNLHSGSQGGGGVSEKKREVNFRLSRRLATGSSISPAPAVFLSGGYPSGPISWVHSEHGQVVSGPVTVSPVPRGNTGLQNGSSATIGSQGVGSHLIRQHDFGQNVGDGSSLVAPARVVGQPDRHGPLLQAPYEEVSNQPPEPLPPLVPQQIAYGPRPPESSPRPSLVDCATQCNRGSPLQGTTPLSHTYVRRVEVGVGSSPPHPQDGGPLVSCPVSTPHQCPRTVGHLSSASSLGPVGQGQNRAGSLRQHDSCDLYQQRGGNQEPQSMQRDSETPEVVQGLGYQANGLPRTGSGQCLGRRSLPERHSDKGSTEGEGIIGGVATPPVSVPLNIPETRPSTRGPVRFCQESSTSSLLFMESGPPGPGTGCNDGRLVRAPSLRLSANCNDPSSAREGCPVPELPGDAGGPSVAPTTVVPSAAWTSSRGTGPTPPAQGLSKRSSSQPSRSGAHHPLPEPDCLAHFRRLYTQAGLSEPAAALAAKARRKSTRKSYNSRLRRYHAWCAHREIDPLSATVGQVADFLLVVFPGWTVRYNG